METLTSCGESRIPASGFTWSSTMENFDLASYSHVRDRGLMLLTDQPPWNYEVLDNDILHLHVITGEIGGYIRTTLSKQKSIVSYNYIMSICLLVFPVLSLSKQKTAF